MCGIFACHRHPDIHGFTPAALRLVKRIRYRGPDGSANIISNNTILCREQLNVVPDDFTTELTSEDGTISCAMDGRIYNSNQIRNDMQKKYTFKTHSNHEVVIPLYLEYGHEAPMHLDGMFSFVLYDKRQDILIAARDPVGITTFYQGWASKEPGTVYFASELKCLQEICDKIIIFPPGHIYDSNSGETKRYFQPSWWNPARTPTAPVDYATIRDALETSVKKRLLPNVQYGVLLSGGLDSGLIAAIAQRETLRLQAMSQELQNGAGLNGGIASHQPSNGINTANNNKSTYPPEILSFSVGLAGSPDNMAALEVARFLGLKHHVITFTIEEALDALSDVIYLLETYDVTTIRSSVPMYLLSRKVKAMGVKMVLGGEGSDGIFGGYLYFHAAPDKTALQDETVRLMKHSHVFDCLRADKTTSAWGVEIQLPFLDKDFLEMGLNIDPEEKRITQNRAEKYILRKAFDTSAEPDANPYLPESILWRQKEQFSDGVGHEWIEALRAKAESQVSDEMMKNPKKEWADDIHSKEGYWYRMIFDEYFPTHCASTVEHWLPNWSTLKDPSGRAISTHVANV